MLKKTILSVAVASVLSLTGCLDNNKNNDNNVGAETNPLSDADKALLLADAGTYPVFNPVISALPLPIDLIYDKVAGDGSFSVSDTLPPVTTALNRLSGASTSAPIDLAISGLIDASSVHASPYLTDGSGNLIIVDGLPVPDPQQNVFLIELAYASGSPLQGLSLQEPPNVVAAAGDTYTAEVKTLDGTSFIRILPKTPLKPDTRYVVVLTDSILDSSGENIKPSPSYISLTKTDEEEALLSTALAPIRALINGLWEAIGVGYFGSATNLSRAAQSLDSLDATNITLSYSFTTSGDEKVLNYIADPAQWFDDQITTFVGVSTATAVVEGGLDVAMLDEDGTTIIPGSDGVTTHADVSLSVAGALAAFPANPSDPSDTTISDALGPLEAAFGLFGCTGVTSGPTYITCISTALANLPVANGGFSDLLPTPADGSMDFSTNTALPTVLTTDLKSILDSVNPLIAGGYALAGFPGFTAPGTYQITQGEVTLPYYAGLPTNPTLGPLALKFTSWEADDALATAINSTFAPLGLSIPQADPDVSTVVNYIFPFPKKQGDVTVPVLAMYPTSPAASMKTVIWGHGLKGSRANVLPFGAGLLGAAKANGVDIAVIAFDQPLHGVVGDTTGFHTDGERHFEYGNAGTGLSNPPLDIDITNLFPAEVGGPQGSGSMFVNLESFATSRDNLRQNALDLMTVRKSLATADLDNDTTADLNANDVYYVGHSLGTISAMPFVAVVNDSTTPTDDITAAAFFTPGGGISRFFENSPTFAPLITTALGGSGLTSDTSGYQTYINVLQAALDSVDGINFVDDFATQNTPVLFVDVVDDTVIPISMNTDDRTLQLAQGEFGNAYEISASVSHLSGSTPLVTTAGASFLLMISEK